MTRYLISFPGSVMDISDEDMAAVGEAARAVIREAKDAGVYVFAGGINEDVAPLMVAADGTVTNETYPRLPLLAGTPRVRVRPRELTGEVAARCERELLLRASSSKSEPRNFEVHRRLSAAEDPERWADLRELGPVPPRRATSPGPLVAKRASAGRCRVSPRLAASSG